MLPLKSEDGCCLWCYRTWDEILLKPVAVNVVAPARWKLMLELKL